ncbi:hypothetical protein CD178_01641 [Komagataeibacter saccharivorans]|uniref:Uncharacterized protein n=1 Tax=Komagataeibacter saccharivorans TaxID=265959 RepID=A0A347WC15_9PROT|nr:hypothetical protein [Komagataeibacter saccharivorans]AXY22408.1 hypothetical protein CD178_01641 [Komagataeibacter saccharivorans]
MNQFSDKQIIYNNKFLEAMHYTNEITKCKYEENIVERKFVDKDFLDFIGQEVSNICQGSVNLLAGQCVSVHWQLANKIRKNYNIDAFVTLGDTVVLKETIYSFSPSSARELLEKKSCDTQLFSGHAWITLLSGEIIDASLQTTIGIRQKNPDFYGNIIAQHAGDLNDTIEYTPTVVGDNYLFLSGLVQRVTYL